MGQAGRACPTLGVVLVGAWPPRDAGRLGGSIRCSSILLGLEGAEVVALAVELDACLVLRLDSV